MSLPRLWLLIAAAMVVAACSAKTAQPAASADVGPADVAAETKSADVAAGGVEVAAGDATATAAGQWQVVAQNQPGAYFSVWGTSKNDVFVAGARNPTKGADGPTALHWDGKAWAAPKTAAPGADYWWVTGLPNGDAWFSGTLGTIGRWHRSDGTISAEKTPGKETIFGLYAGADNDIWAVGGNADCTSDVCGVIWHFDGKAWAAADVPKDLLKLSKQWFKAWRHKGALYVVGSWTDDKNPSSILQFDGKAWSAKPSDVFRTLLTIAGNDAAAEPSLIAVGGTNEGMITQMQADGAWKRFVGAKKFPPFNGVCVAASGNPVAVGAGAALYERKAGAWISREDLPDVSDDDFHGCWLSPDGEIWAAGGQILSIPQTSGLLVRFGAGAISTKLP